jgi:NRAMP (natural resistance-associated macrophage protein)-like metal ion transporter
MINGDDVAVDANLEAARADDASRGAQLDDMHVGDINGALGTILREDTNSRKTLRARFVTFLAILGPGLIVMIGDNDAGAFGTYAQAGQNYGTTLLWTLLLLIPVLYVNQEMVLRLGAVTGVGHARLILERFGKFWGAFSVIDLLILNALTIVTEFIGISLALDFFGLPKIAGVVVAAVLVMVGAAQGNFRRFERFCLVLCLGSLFLLPVLIAVHAPLGQSVHNFFVPGLPKGAGLSTVMLLIAAIVGTTVAPWQLFFQQSYVIDKRITPRFINYERWDLVVGIGFVVFGAIAIVSVTAATFAGHREFGSFQDAGAVAAGIARYVGYWPGAFFAIALADASVVGAAAVSLSTAYAVGDVLSLRHSLHRKVSDAPVFYGVYLLLIAAAAALVLIPGAPLGLLTNAVQVLAGVLLPSATVFLLLLSNDKAVLGPWANTNRVNVFTGVVIALLVVLSILLTCSTLFSIFGTTQILWTLGIGLAASLGVGVWLAVAHRQIRGEAQFTREQRASWQMPPLAQLPPGKLSALNRFWLIILRAYLLGAIALVIYKVTLLALNRG